MNRYSHLLTASCIAFFVATITGTGVSASESEKKLIKRGEPALLVARQVHYDEQTSTATASGDVEIVQGETILRADNVVYNVEKDIVTANGHVSMLQPSGDVFFADHVTLTQKMQEGVVKNIKARLSNNALFAARRGEKVSKNVTHLERLVFSPCKVCRETEEGKGSAPLWQIQARKATIDEEAKRITYRDAFFDVYGVPVMYTPYFSQPTPDAPSQSGLLTPLFFHATDLGNVVKLPVYASLAPDMDMTLTPWYISNEKPLVSGEFRKLFEQGNLTLKGAFTETYNRDSSGNIIPGNQNRGYIEAHGRYQINDYWRAGLDAERTTDDTFLQLYRIGWRDMLTSRLYAERIHDRNYAVIETMSFQGLTTIDDSKLSPNILPKADMHYELDPQLWHSRVTLDSGLLVAQQQQGVSTRRISSNVGWKVPYITSGGQVFEATASLRGDGYDISDQTTDFSTHSTFSGTLGRVIPQLDLGWRYPFVNALGNGKSLMLSPVAELTLSPRRALSSKFPNTDSQVTELSDVNLFSPSRFTGIDQIETGARFTYGARGHLQNANDEWVEWLFGQTYQENDDSPFPITSSQGQHFSDYIGRMSVKYKWFDIAYSFRLNRSNMSPISNNVNMMFQANPVYFDISYVALRNDRVFGNRQEVFGNATWDITPVWRLSMNGRRDLGSNEQAIVTAAQPLNTSSFLEPAAGTVGLGSSLTYHNECLMVTASVGRSYINQQDVRPSTTFGLMVTLTPSGNNSANNASTLTGAGNIGAVNPPDETKFQSLSLPGNADSQPPRSTP